MSEPTADIDGKTSAPAPAENRAWVRHRCDLETCCRPVANSRSAMSWPARVWDISEGGIGLLISRRFELGTVLVLEVQALADEAPEVLLARVTRMGVRAGMQWLLGCRLVGDLSDEQLQGMLAPPAPEPVLEEIAEPEASPGSALASAVKALRLHLRNSLRNSP